MKVLRGVDQVRSNPGLYLGANHPSGTFLATCLAGQAIDTGASRVTIRRFEDGWMAVSADIDWIMPALNARSLSGYQSAFEGIIPFDHGQPNETRFEVIVAAFAENVAVKAGKVGAQISGHQAPSEILKAVDAESFTVLFQAVRQTENANPER